MECNYKMKKPDGSVIGMKEVTSLWGLTKHMYLRGEDGILYFKENHSANVFVCGNKQLAGNIDVAFLWEEFGDVSMNPETECMDESWNRCKEGTFREDIWHWFENEFGASVGELMYA
jgi:hypothetical protein